MPGNTAHKYTRNTRKYPLLSPPRPRYTPHKALLCRLLDMHHTSPTYFDDQLKDRAFRHRFRSIGSPYAFLSDVGLVPMLEYIYKGNTVIDLAHEMDISVTILKRWLKEEGHEGQITEAESVSAEGYLAKAFKNLRGAATDFELKKAQAELKHAHFMAEKKNKGVYGVKPLVSPSALPGGAGVTFVLNMAGPASQGVTINALPVTTLEQQELVQIVINDPLGAVPAYLNPALEHTR